MAQDTYSVHTNHFEKKNMDNGIRKREPNPKIDEYRKMASRIDWYSPHQPKTKLQFVIEYFLRELDEREKERNDLILTIHTLENGEVPGITTTTFRFCCYNCGTHCPSIDHFWEHYPCEPQTRTSRSTQTDPTAPRAHRTSQT